MRRGIAVTLVAWAAGCATTGSGYMTDDALSADDTVPSGDGALAPSADRNAPLKRRTTTVIGREIEEDEPTRVTPTAPTAATTPRRAIEGRVVGTFRNTYYDFPAETDFQGQPVPLKNARCETIKEVPRGFHDAVCVQGSGTLAGGEGTVSFAKRDCECALECPRTNQRICFDKLDAARFPFGRGATGKPITPLYSVAVDSTQLPLGTTIYIPEYDGLPRDEARTQAHDGCFVAQDRGMKVVGKHVDVFTGSTRMTKLWNALVPSNQGVTVVLDSPRCAKETLTSAPAEAPLRERERERRREEVRESERDPEKRDAAEGKRESDERSGDRRTERRERESGDGERKSERRKRD